MTGRSGSNEAGVRSGPSAGTGIPSKRDATAEQRAQSNVLGVAVLIGLTVLALGGLTAGIGSMIHSGATAADTERVADGLASTVAPGETVGVEEGDLRISEGVLRSEPRTLRVLNATAGERIGDSEVTVEVIEEIPSDAVVYEADDRQVVVHGGAVLRVDDGDARIHREPRIVADRDPGGVLVIGAPSIDAGDLVMSTGRDEPLRVRTEVTHERIDLGEGTYQVAVETDHPAAWERYFERQGATVVATAARFEGDERDSVVAHFHGQRRAYVVVHQVDLEVERR